VQLHKGIFMIGTSRSPMTGKAGAMPRRTPSFQDVLALAARVLEERPNEALARAEAVLRQAPGLPPAELLACQALRRLGRSNAALPRLVALARAQPGVPAVNWELAQAASESGHTNQAITVL